MVSNKKIKVGEFFPGVGGFRLGLEGWNGKSPNSGYSKKIDSKYEVVFSNQWEPSTKVQHASMVYENRWGKNGHSNQDISTIEIKEIPNIDLLVGGFPCQDYSVATTLKNSKGLIGKKGVLWWSIHRILCEMKQPPQYLFLENVDRLLISPAEQRGRDFRIILQSLNDLGYAVEWRVINAGRFWVPTKEKKDIHFGLSIKKQNSIKIAKKTNPSDYILNQGIISLSLPVVQFDSTKEITAFSLSGDIVDISNNFNKDKSENNFENSGFMIDGNVYTTKTKPNYDGSFTYLKDIILTKNVPEEYFIDNDTLDKWNYLKGSKKEMRKNSDGFEYHYSEGGMIFPDPLDKPSRTIITGEGGSSPSRFKHVISTNRGLRRLTPLELERLNMFPDNHTELEGITDTKRVFFMGNALVVGVIESIAKVLQKKILEK